MGWLSYFLLGDLGQQMDINEQRAEMDRLREELNQAKVFAPSGQQQGDIRRLQKEIDELRLYVAALTRLLISATVVDKDELASIVREIDASDGESDGKYGGDMP